jgi:hypothetical protein
MSFRLKCCLLYSSHIVTPYSQSFCVSSINGSKKTTMSLPACLEPNTRVVNKRYFHLWHNHGGRLNMHIIIGHVLCGFLISLNGFIPSMLSPNMIFLGWRSPPDEQDQIISTVCHLQGVESFHPSCNSYAKAIAQHPLGLRTYDSSSRSQVGTT